MPGQAGQILEQKLRGFKGLLINNNNNNLYLHYSVRKQVQKTKK